MSDIVSYKPRLGRSWSPRHGRFFWNVLNGAPVRSWGCGASVEAMRSYHAAYRWCYMQNKAANQKPAP